MTHEFYVNSAVEIRANVKNIDNANTGEDFDLIIDHIIDKGLDLGISVDSMIDSNVNTENDIIGVIFSKNEKVFVDSRDDNSIGHYRKDEMVTIDVGLAEKLNELDKFGPADFNEGDTFKINNVVNNMSTNVIEVRLNSYVLRDETINIMLDYNELAKEEEK